MKLGFKELQELSSELGASFYLLDLEGFKGNYGCFLGAFRKHYARTSIAYSYKTNYTPALCAFVNAAGGYAEVVSGMEYELALRVGVSAERIIFNGPYKSREELERALTGGSIVNLDGLEEVAALESIAAGHAGVLRVALRCNFPIGEPSISRFGFDVFGEEFKTAFKRLERHRNVELLGLHCHYTTRGRRPESFALRTRMLLELATQYFPGNGPRLLNLGGGYFSRMGQELQLQLGVSAPRWEEYAEAIAGQMAKAYGGRGPELILEPGSALASDVQTFVARIVEVKKVRSRALAVCAGSIHNIKPTLHPRNMPVEMVRGGGQGRSINGLVDIVGYTCMEHDCLHAGYQGEIGVGDYAVFPNVGSYTTVMKPPFIQGAPPIVAPDRNGYQWVRRQEGVEQILATYCMGGAKRERQ